GLWPKRGATLRTVLRKFRVEHSTLFNLLSEAIIFTPEAAAGAKKVLASRSLRDMLIGTRKT
ncbi:MAG: hypothetical protein M3362_25915, partial [Acidobacteriota bacterium]|nr:hypothetical protein [Acidobacteriota bacterium]